MTWTTITPDIADLRLAPVTVIANGWQYPNGVLQYDDPTITVHGGPDVILWLEGRVTRIEQDDQAWRVHLDDGTYWDVARTTGHGCACSGGNIPTPIV